MSYLDPWENAPLDWHGADPALRDPLDGARPTTRARRDSPGQSFRPEPIQSYNSRPSLDDLPEEHPLTIEINGRAVAQLQFSGDGARELALGWAFSRGIAPRLSAIQRTTVYQDRVSLMIPGSAGAIADWERLAATGYRPGACSSMRANDPPTAAAEDDVVPDRAPLTSRSRLTATVDEVFARFRRAPLASLLHHAGLASIGDIPAAPPIHVVARDIGQDNAVDKLIGWLLSSRVDRRDLALVLSCPISSNIVARAWRTGLPLVVTSARATVEAIDLAHALSITAITGALGNRPAIYTHPWRIGEDDDRS